MKAYKNNSTHFNSAIDFLRYFTSLLLSTLTREFIKCFADVLTPNEMEH